MKTPKFFFSFVMEVVTRNLQRAKRLPHSICSKNAKMFQFCCANGSNR